MKKIKINENEKIELYCLLSQYARLFSILSWIEHRKMEMFDMFFLKCLFKNKREFLSMANFYFERYLITMKTNTIGFSSEEISLLFPFG
jgi:hypothetical protein